MIFWGGAENIMTFYVHNPHVESHFGKSCYRWLSRKFCPYKYGWFMDASIKSGGGFCMDGIDSSFSGGLKELISPKIEYNFWKFLNGIPSNVELISLGDVRNLSATDVIFFFAFRNLDRENEDFISAIKQTPAKKVCHLTHYMVNTSLISNNAERLGVDYFVAESNLYKNSEYFRYHFPWYKKDVLIMPFLPASRFVNRVPFNRRINKCLATGTVLPLSENKTYGMDEMVAYFNTRALHPMRLAIYEQVVSGDPHINSLIPHFIEKEHLNISKDDLFFIRKLKAVRNHFAANQSKYHSINIVAEYNRHKMFVVPEEIVGLPAIGSVEGMACGSAFIGLDDPMYKDLGMKDGVHYIAYDGTLDGLREKIKYYQTREEQLKKIAVNGCRFVTETLNPSQVFNNFIQRVYS